MDENKQIEEMAKCCPYYHKGECCADATDISKCDLMCEMFGVFANLEAAGYRKQEWISVEERLPTEQREVLTYYGFDHGDGDLGMMFTGVLTYFPFDKKPHFQHEETGLRVTHWMPLPEPPKGE